MEISFQGNLAEWARDLPAHFARQVPFATALALTDTAKAVRVEHQRLMPQIFDRPTPYTLRSLQVTPARKGQTVATVWFKDQARRSQHYLVPQVYGGTRPHKGFEKWLIGRGIMLPAEYAVPGPGARMDAAGNMSRGQVVQILSQLQVGPDAHQWETARSRRRAGKRRNRYFVPQPGSRLPRGVWMSTGKRQPVPILLFVRQPTYRAIYDFEGISRRVAIAHFEDAFVAALNRAVATSWR